MSFQDDMAQMVLDMAAEFPVTVTFTVATTTENPTTGEVITTSETDYDVMCPPPFDFEESMIDGKTVLQGDTQLVLPTEGISFVPTMLQSCSFDQIVGAQTLHFECSIIPPLTPLSTGSRVAAYLVHLRQIRS